VEEKDTAHYTSPAEAKPRLRYHKYGLGHENSAEYRLRQTEKAGAPGMDTRTKRSGFRYIYSSIAESYKVDKAPIPSAFVSLRCLSELTS
jgi:hypothetical protein